MSTQFVVRITIHDGSEKDYEELHAQLALIGFFRTVVATNGQRFMLPDATYVGESFLTSEQVRDTVVYAAQLAAPKTELPDVAVFRWTDGAVRLKQVPAGWPWLSGLAA